ncbi:MAG: DUF3833 domain-containing protein [Rhodobacteraceae bacterium]|nr:DUF3833 domain-containing protein [Paracoccaceae bacterium]
MYCVVTPRPRFLAAAMVILAACSGRPSLDDPALSSRDLELERFFSGPLIAHGQFQDRFGTVRARFRVDMVGTWDGTNLRLDEDFIYDDGRTDNRVWTLTKTGPESWQGTAPDVIGVATGREKGDTFNWAYTVDLPQGDSTLRVQFDDWMWKMSETRLINRAYVRKLGVTVGEVIILFEKPGAP